MIKFKKKYPTTSKINYAFCKYYAALALAEYYVKSDKHDRAVQAFIDAEVLNKKAWLSVFELYPTFKSRECTYFKYEHTIKIKDKPNER